MFLWGFRSWCWRQVCGDAERICLCASGAALATDGPPVPHRPPARSWYDPLKKETNLNAPAIKQWLANGAQPSDTVRNLLKKAYVIEASA